MATANHIHVFYTDSANGWASQSRDSEGNQIAAAAYYYLKSDAIAHARKEGVPVSVYGRNGLFQHKV